MTFDSLQKLLHYIYDCWLHILFIVKYKMEYSMWKLSNCLIKSHCSWRSSSIFCIEIFCFIFFFFVGLVFSYWNRTWNIIFRYLQCTVYTILSPKKRKRKTIPFPSCTMCLMLSLYMCAVILNELVGEWYAQLMFFDSFFE